MERVVRVLTTRVSMKVPVIAINPFFGGSDDLDADWAIAADPKPDSLERRPLLTPMAMAWRMDVPTIAPPTALIEKADLKITDKACGRLVILAAMMTMAPPKYKMIIVGTNLSDTPPILLMPPRTTMPTKVVITRPVSQNGTPN